MGEPTASVLKRPMQLANGREWLRRHPNGETMLPQWMVEALKEGNDE
jgi:hypothetical protein